jgi:hypothetical protein
MPAVKTLLRDLTLNSGGIMKLGYIGTDIDGVKFRGNNEALLHWERHRWFFSALTPSVKWALEYVKYMSNSVVTGVRV